jgi:hypothetical protein
MATTNESVKWQRRRSDIEGIIARGVVEKYVQRGNNLVDRAHETELSYEEWNELRRIGTWLARIGVEMKLFEKPNAEQVINQTRVYYNYAIEKLNAHWKEKKINI